MAVPLTDQILEAYLDEALSADQMSRIEKMLREDEATLARLANLCGRREAGMHSISEIWRRHRVSCPTREQLGSYLLSALMDAQRDYIEFHLNEMQCRYCQSNLEDLQSASNATDSSVQVRRQRYFQSSAGYLRRDR